MTTEEMLLQLIEGQKQMSADISNLNERLDKIEADIDEIKENTEITRYSANRSGEFLEKFSSFLEPYNIGIKY